MPEELKRGQYRPVTIELGGETRTLRMTWGAMRKIRDATDGRVDFFRGGLADADPHEFPIVVWACLTHKGEGGDPSLTLEDVEEMVDPTTQDDVAAAVFEMFGVDLDEAVRLYEEQQAGDADGADPLAEAEASETPSSSSGPRPAPSSDSPSTMTFGNAPPVSTPRSETPTSEPSDGGTGEPAS